MKPEHQQEPCPLPHAHHIAVRMLTKSQPRAMTAHTSCTPTHCQHGLQAPLYAHCLPLPDAHEPHVVNRHTCTQHPASISPAAGKATAHMPHELHALHMYCTCSTSIEYRRHGSPGRDAGQAPCTASQCYILLIHSMSVRNHAQLVPPKHTWEHKHMTNQQPNWLSTNNLGEPAPVTVCLLDMHTTAMYLQALQINSTNTTQTTLCQNPAKGPIRNGYGSHYGLCLSSYCLTTSHRCQHQQQEAGCCQWLKRTASGRNRQIYCPRQRLQEQHSAQHKPPSDIGRCVSHAASKGTLTLSRLRETWLVKASMHAHGTGRQQQPYPSRRQLSH